MSLIKRNYARVINLEGKYVRSTRFASVGTISGTVTLPPNSQVVLDDFGGTVDAVVSSLDGGRPSLLPVYTSGGVLVGSSFDSSGNYTLTGIPTSYPVAIIYRVRTKLSLFDSEATDIIGQSTLEGGGGGPGHNPVTITTPANGLSIDGAQDLSLAQASATTDGALTGTDWSTFNSKQPALGFTPENVSNKDATDTLGASDTKYPTQKAVKTYVDTGLGTKPNMSALDTEILFDDAGTIKGATNFTYNKTSKEIRGQNNVTYFILNKVLSPGTGDPDYTAADFYNSNSSAGVRMCTSDGDTAVALLAFKGTNIAVMGTPNAAMEFQAGNLYAAHASTAIGTCTVGIYTNPSTSKTYIGALGVEDFGDGTSAGVAAIDGDDNAVILADGTNAITAAGKVEITNDTVGIVEICKKATLTESPVGIHFAGGDIDVRIGDLDIYGAAMILNKGLVQTNFCTVGEAMALFAPDVEVRVASNDGFAVAGKYTDPHTSAEYTGGLGVKEIDLPAGGSVSVGAAATDGTNLAVIADGTNALNIITGPIAVSDEEQWERSGTGLAELGNNCPADDTASPHKWLRIKDEEGNTLYIPAWK